MNRVGKYLWVGTGFIISLVAANAIVTMQWMYLAALIVLLVIILGFEKNFFPMFFGLYAFMLPLDSIFLLAGVGTASSLTKYVAVATLAGLFLKGALAEKFRRPDKTVIWWILLSLYSLLTLIWSIEPNIDTYLIRNVVMFPMFYLVVSSYKTERRDYELVKWCTVAGGFVAAMLSIYNYDTLLQADETIKRVSVVLGDRASSLNGLALSLLLPLAICIEVMFREGSKAKKSIFTGIAGLILFSIALTGSRGGMLSVVVILLGFFLLSRKKAKLLSLVIAFAVLISIFAPSFFFARWGTAVETGGSGRLSIWLAGVKALEKYWLSGAGLYAFPAAYNEFLSLDSGYYKPNMGAHNLFLGMSVELGIVGFSLMIAGLVSHYKALDKVVKFERYELDAIMLKASFWALLVSSCFLDTFWYKQMWLLWMLIMIRRNALKHERASLLCTTSNNSY